MSVEDFYTSDLDYLIEIFDSYNTYETFKVRNLWEVGRATAFNSAKVHFTKPVSLHEFFPLSWDNEPDEADHCDITDEDIDFLKSLNAAIQKDEK